MKEIKLTKGKVALVDDEDYPELSKWSWFANPGKNDNFYAARRMSLGNSKSKIVLMHRVILNITDTKTKVDHEDHNGLNNQRYNIRPCTTSQNNMNTVAQKKSTSKFLGVSWAKEKNKWLACIGVNHKTVYLGRYFNEEDAAKAYDEAAKKHFGKFANLNFK